MHDTALEIGRLFFESHAKPPCLIVELGSMNVNGALRSVSPRAAAYVGLDVGPGPGVDVIIKAKAPLPLKTDAADIVVSSSMFEHDDFFWETFLEMVRITKPGGAIYINAPSNGPYHRYPADNWRFYPDSGHALQHWGRRNGYPLTLAESFIAERKKDIWNDFVAIFIKSEAVEADGGAFLSDRIACTNAWRLGESEPALRREASEDMLLIEALRRQPEPPEGRSPGLGGGAMDSLARSVPAVGDEGTKKAPVSLIPHVNRAFPKIAELLSEPDRISPELQQEISSLLEGYARRWPFDERFYLRTYGDVAVAIRQGKIGSAFLHFCGSGYAEGRLPIDPEVDPIWYLETYPDVVNAIQEGLVANADDHFRRNGYREGRYPSHAANLLTARGANENGPIPLVASSRGERS